MNEKKDTPIRDESEHTAPSQQWNSVEYSGAKTNTVFGNQSVKDTVAPSILQSMMVS